MKFFKFVAETPCSTLCLKKDPVINLAQLHNIY